ncbi:MAG: DUF1592 domain-containing protein [Myxococcota bacterium]
MAALLGGCVSPAGSEEDSDPPLTPPPPARTHPGDDPPVSDPPPPLVPPRADVESCATKPLEVGESPLQRLTQAQFRHSLQDLFPSLDVDQVLGSMAPDGQVEGFPSNAFTPIDALAVERVMDAAEAIAAAATEDADGFLGCPATRRPCRRGWMETFLARALRRAPDDPEVASDVDAFEAALCRGASGADCIRLVITATLLSPRFLYLLERPHEAENAGQSVALRPAEVASRMALFLWSSIPDEDLLRAASAGALANPEGRAAEARRMLEDPKAQRTIENFHLQWLELSHLTHADKDPSIFPDFDPDLREHMETETRHFATWVFEQGDGNFETLLTSRKSVVSAPLAAHYGVPHEGPEYRGGRVVDLDTARSGLLTHASFLSAHSPSNQTSPVQRGYVLRQQFLCSVPPPPGPDVDDDPPALDPTLSTAERFRQHRDNEQCRGCHLFMDPLGFGLEGFDAVGRFRTEEAPGVAVEDEGEIFSTLDIDGPFEGARALAERFATSKHVHRCVADKWFIYALGRSVGALDKCSMAKVDQRFEESGHDLRELMVALVESDAFVYGTPAADPADSE